MFCYQVSFIKLLSDVSLNPDWVDLMLAIINKALQGDSSVRVFKEKLNSVLMEESCPFLNEVRHL